jgi:hypothetical protein
MQKCVKIPAHVSSRIVIEPSIVILTQNNGRLFIKLLSQTINRHGNGSDYAKI